MCQQFFPSLYSSMNLGSFEKYEIGLFGKKNTSDFTSSSYIHLMELSAFICSSATVYRVCAKFICSFVCADICIEQRPSMFSCAKYRSKIKPVNFSDMFIIAISELYNFTCNYITAVSVKST